MDIEVDSEKMCVHRFAHREIMGEDRPEGRVCPACIEEDGES